LGDEYIMFDCGPSATAKLVKAGLFPTQIDYLFFTHHHFDHDVDYPCFLLTRWDQSVGKEKQLQVYGPTLTERLTLRLLDENQGAFAHDWLARVNSPGSQRVYVNRGGTLPRKPPSVMARDIGPGKVYVGKDWEVTAAVAEHAQPWLDSLAYRVDSPDVSVVFTGDTRRCESVAELAKDADVMLCCCWDDQERMEARGEDTGICGTLDAARLAQEAGVKKLVLVHIGPELAKHGAMEKGIGDVKRVYDGEVIFAEELMSFSVGEHA
jgi:ribonuclease BN (tRNA processing enzyme)